MMLHMRLGLMVGLMLMTMAMQAIGADLGKGRGGPDRAYYGPVYNWSGMYYGGTVGAADGGIGIAAHVGYNWMMPRHIVFGIEGELGWLEDDRSHHASGGVFGT